MTPDDPPTPAPAADAAAAASPAAPDGADATAPSEGTPTGIRAALTGAARTIATSMRASTPTPAAEASAAKKGEKDEEAMDVEAAVAEMAEEDAEKKEEGGEWIPLAPPLAAEETKEAAAAMTDANENSPAEEEPPAAKDAEEAGKKAVEEKDEAAAKKGEAGGVEPMASSNNDDAEEVEEDSVGDKVKRTKRTAEALAAKRLGEELDGALDALHESISVAILAHRTEEENAVDADETRKGNDAYAQLREAAAAAHRALVAYGATIDLSAQSTNEDSDAVALSEARRARLLDHGKNLWMAIRSHPTVFNDMVGEDKAGGGGDVASYEGRKARAIAGGYARSVAARLVFVEHIDARCSVGKPPVLVDPLGSGADGRKRPTLHELGWGLKLFARAGRAILAHERKDARSAYDAASLAVACFDAIAAMAADGSGEAADQLRELFDEAFDAISTLPNAASLLGEGRDESRDDTSTQLGGVSWEQLVIECLEKAESFVDGHCNVFKNGGEEGRSASKLAALQRFLPSLARLCYKHGSHFVKVQDHENANKALHIALKSTNSCLGEIREELEQGKSRKGKGKQMLMNLEAELVVVSIEAFYLLSVSYQATGERDKAFQCLDQVERYMNQAHARDNELYSNVNDRLNSGEDFVFSEGGATSALEGTKVHLEKDKADIKARAHTALEDAKNRHAAERATLAFSRIMIYHKAAPAPSLEDESLIDSLLRELVDLSVKFATVSSSAQHAVAAADQPSSSDKIFDLALQAIRVVHVRRTIAKVSGVADNYKILLDKLTKDQTRYAFVMLDKLNAMLCSIVRAQNDDGRSQLDSAALKVAKEYLETARAFFDRPTSAADTTLFAASTDSLCDELFEKSKLHLARAVSLYHSLEAHGLCAQWADLLRTFVQMKQQKGETLEDLEIMQGEVMTVQAYSLSMGGSHASGVQIAREAWKKVKTVDSLVNLFHCSLRHELKHHSCDTMLEFDAALNELLALSSDSVVDEVLAAFPRLSNSCAESSEVSGSELLLLGVQERWIDLLLSRLFLQHAPSGAVHLVHLEKNAASTHSEIAFFSVLRPYLENFEHVISLKEGHPATERNFEEGLIRIVDGTLKLLVQLRDTKKEKKKSRRKKRKNAENSGTADSEAGFVLLFDDPATKESIGNRNDCVWTAEQLWNIGNKLLAKSQGASGDADKRGIAADVFAASHDFCLMSEEESGQTLSRGFLDWDVKWDPTKTMLPNFRGSNERAPCDISSEFSGQCLLISVATAVDFASSRMSGNVQNDVQILLSRSLHRLAQAQEELQLNCDEDEQQRADANKMIVLLTLRALLGVGEDSLALESLESNGLFDALLKLHRNEVASLSQTDDNEGFGSQLVTLRNVKLMSDLAGERKMPQTSRCLQRLCAQQLSQTGKFVIHIGDFELSLGEMQRRFIQSAPNLKDVMDMYGEIDALVVKHQKDGNGGNFYTTSDVTWFAKNAWNRALQHEMLGDDETAAQLFATALNLLPMCEQDLQCYAQAMNTAYQQVTSRARGDTLSSLWNLIE